MMEYYLLLFFAAALIPIGIYGLRAKRHLSKIDRLLSGHSALGRLNPSAVSKVEKLLEHFEGMEADLARQRDEREVVLAEMREGIIGIDATGRVFRMNLAAFELLGAKVREIELAPLTDIVREASVLELAARVLRERVQEEQEITIAADGERRTLNLYARLLHNSQGKFLGVLIVLNDISRLKRLEELKSDFVANVSHELKTPITSIQGFAETLLSGALNDRTEAPRFLTIILRQAERLHAIIDDLLTLSTLEQNRDGIGLSSVPLLQVVRESVEVCASKAEAKQIPILIEGSDVQVRASSPLLVQAVVNLIENAIKYSDSKAAIVIRLEELFGGTARLSVIDQGRGIEAKHLPRLFERFYRADKARSRKEGGTGLGLAIVKHIMHVHGGSADVTSSPGMGSTFSLTLPKA